MNDAPVGRRMEILLVEDSLDDASTTIEALHNGKVPCRVSLVRDGEEAMQFVRREWIYTRAPRPDLILLDMELPKKDGHQVLAELRADPELREISVIVLTASRVHRAVLQAEDLRVDAFMVKPVSFEQFIDAIKTLRRSWLEEILIPYLQRSEAPSGPPASEAETLPPAEPK